MFEESVFAGLGDDLPDTPGPSTGMHFHFARAKTHLATDKRAVEKQFFNCNQISIVRLFSRKYELGMLSCHQNFTSFLIHIPCAIFDYVEFKRGKIVNCLNSVHCSLKIF